MAFLPATVWSQGPAALAVPNPFDELGGFVADRIVDSVRALLRALAEDFLANLAAPVARYVLHTPDLMAEATLRQYWLVALSCLLAVAGLMMAIAGTAMIPGATTRVSLAAREVVGVRLVGCVLTAAVSLPLIALEVGLANRLVDTLIPAGFSSGDNPLWSALTAAVRGDAAAGLALLVTTVVGVALLVGLVVLGLARWATLWLLVVCGPFFMGFAMLPNGAGMARVWWRLQLAAAFLPIGHAVLLGTYVAMFTSEQSGLVGALSGVAVLALMTKLPGWAAGIAIGIEAGEITHRLRRGARPVRAVATRTVSVVSGGGASSAAASSGQARAAYQGRPPSTAPGFVGSRPSSVGSRPGSVGSRPGGAPGGPPAGGGRPAPRPR